MNILHPCPRYWPALKIIFMNILFLMLVPLYGQGLPESPLKSIQLKAPFTIVYRVMVSSSPVIAPTRTTAPEAAHTVLLTLSAKDNFLLVRAQDITAKATHVVILDGKKTYVSSGNTPALIDLGVHVEEMGSFFMPSVGLPYIPLMSREIPLSPKNAAVIKKLDSFNLSGKKILLMSDPRAKGLVRHIGLIPCPYAAPMSDEPVYVGGTVASLMQGNQPKIMWADTFSPEGPDNVWEFTKHQSFQGLWLASNILYSRYNTTSSPPTLILRSRYQLVSASLSPLDSSEYQIAHYLHSYQDVNDWTTNSGIAYPYNPNGGSFDQQRERQKILDAEQKSKSENGDIPGRAKSGLFLILALVIGTSALLFWRQRTRVRS